MYECLSNLFEKIKSRIKIILNTFLRKTKKENDYEEVIQVNTYPVINQEENRIKKLNYSKVRSKYNLNNNDINSNNNNNKNNNNRKFLKKNLLMFNHEYKKKRIKTFII